MPAALRRAPLLMLPLLLLLPTPSGATPNFPGAVRAHLGLSRTPDCSLCHVGPQQVGTVNTPFGVSMRSRGLVFYDEASLRRALDALAAERTDSDRDGTGDIDELKAGGNPNVAGGGGGGNPDGGTGGGGGGGGTGDEAPSGPPVYGCSAGGPASALLGALLALLLLLRARRPA